MAESGPLTLREADRSGDADTVAALLVEYLTWVVGRLLEEYGVDHPPTDPAHARARIAEYRRPDGRLLIAERDGRPVGVAALRRLSGEVIEFKRMYVVPGARGGHVGSALLDRLLTEAQSMGAATARLDTCRFMTDAQRLYRSRGFVERSPYEGTEIPTRLHQHWAFFERPL